MSKVGKWCGDNPTWRATATLRRMLAIDLRDYLDHHLIRTAMEVL